VEVVALEDEGASAVQSLPGFPPSLRRRSRIARLATAASHSPCCSRPMSAASVEKVAPLLAVPSFLVAPGQGQGRRRRRALSLRCRLVRPSLSNDACLAVEHGRSRSRAWPWPRQKGKGRERKPVAVAAAVAVPLRLLPESAGNDPAAGLERLERLSSSSSPSLPQNLKAVERAALPGGRRAGRRSSSVRSSHSLAPLLVHPRHEMFCCAREGRVEKRENA